MTLRFITLLPVFALVTSLHGQSNQQVEWPYYGGDQAGTKYSSLTDINPQNIQRLSVAWQWKHFDTRLAEYGTTPASFEATPVMINGVLYVTTPYNNIAALDAGTGKELWRFDAQSYKLGQVVTATGWHHRGTAFWRDGGKLRVLLNSRNNLFELDAATGKPVPSFGDNGTASLVTGLQRMPDPTPVTQSSPPVVYKDLVILGSQIADHMQQADPVGYVQAFNARTGKRVWSFSVIPQSSKDAGASTWENESWRNAGNGNVWAPMTLDEARGLIYLPTSTPSGDYDLAKRAGLHGIQEWLSFFFKSPMCAPQLYPEHDLFIQSMKFKNTLRWLMNEDLITHLGSEYYD